MDPIIELRAAGRAFRQGQTVTDALKPTTLAIERGDLIALVGRSGSGKSTMLNLITGVDRPTTGEVIVDGVELNTLGEGRMAAYRGRKVGVVFQFFELIPTLTALENIVLAMDLVEAIPHGKRRKRALELLDQVGLKGHANKLPSRLSGGEQQRAAIARALANDSPILVADEPSGALDTANAAMIIDLFDALARAGRTIVVATHDREHLHRYRRVVDLADGAVAGESSQ